MLSDPQTITISGTATDLNKVSTQGQQSIYQSADGKQTLVVSHQRSGNRNRHLFGYTEKVIAADPVSGTNREQSCSVNFIVDEPFGADWAFSDSHISAVIEAMKSLFTTTTQTKFLSGQS